jgi:hypothetical protein
MMAIMLDRVGYLARNFLASFSFTPNIGDWIVVFFGRMSRRIEAPMIIMIIIIIIIIFTFMSYGWPTSEGCRDVLS